MTTLLLRVGDDFLYTATVRDRAGGLFDLTGSTLWITIKRYRSDADADAIACLYWQDGIGAAGISVADESTGEADIRLTPSQTLLFEQAAYVWDLQIQDAAGAIRTVDRGTLVAQMSVTTRTTTP